jgi:hypothetical protein
MIAGRKLPNRALVRRAESQRTRLSATAIFRQGIPLLERKACDVVRILRAPDRTDTGFFPSILFAGYWVPHDPQCLMDLSSHPFRIVLDHYLEANG